MGASLLLRTQVEKPASLEETKRVYAVAKIGGSELCLDPNREYGTQYQSLVPTNLYGPGDNSELETRDGLPALVRRLRKVRVEWPDEAGGPPPRASLAAPDRGLPPVAAVIPGPHTQREQPPHARTEIPLCDFHPPDEAVDPSLVEQNWAAAE
jgi:hypothetical protein